MFSTPLTTRRRRLLLLLASSMLAPVFTVSLAHAQQPPSETLPPVEISAPVDQNKTRAKPTYDEFSGPRRPAPGVTPADAKPAGGDRLGRHLRRLGRQAAAAASSFPASSARPRP